MFAVVGAVAAVLRAYPVRRMAEVNASDVDAFSVNDLCPFVRSREAIPRIIDL